MKSIFAVATAIALIAVAGPGMAAGTASLSVTATVSPACGFSTVPTTAVAFTIDPGSTAVANSTGGSVSAWCTTGQNGIVTIGAGLNDSGGNKRMVSLNAPGTPIVYTLSMPVTAVVGAGRSNATVLTVNGQVQPIDFQNANPAVDYTDTVTLTINP